MLGIDLHNLAFCNKQTKKGKKRVLILFWEKSGGRDGTAKISLKISIEKGVLFVLIRTGIFSALVKAILGVGILSPGLCIGCKKPLPGVVLGRFDVLARILEHRARCRGTTKHGCQHAQCKHSRERNTDHCCCKDTLEAILLGVGNKLDWKLILKVKLGKVFTSLGAYLDLQPTCI